MTEPQPKVLTVRTLHRGKHLSLEFLEYQDRRGNVYPWERVSRAAHRGSVSIIARLMPSERYVLVRQFRPPLDCEIYEFPAGLIDDGESAEQTALRELKEETGYSGRVTRLLPPRSNSPGLSAESTWIVIMEIDESLEDNIKPMQQLDGAEDISVWTLTAEEGLQLALAGDKNGILPDAKITSYFLGLECGRSETDT